MASVGRPTRFTRGEIEIRQWFLDRLVDDNGDKVSLRTLWWSDEFVEFSGMTGERQGKKSSAGTMSYWVYDKWQLSDRYVFDYHRNITNRIPIETDFYDWVATCKYGKHKEAFALSKYDEVIVRKVLNVLLKEAGENYVLDELSPIKPYWNMLLDNKMFRNNEKLLKSKFKKLYQDMKGR